jgi:hypothetical protein
MAPMAMGAPKAPVLTMKQLVIVVALVAAMQNRAIVSADALVFGGPTEGEAGRGGFICDAITERRTPTYATRGKGA